MDSIPDLSPVNGQPQPYSVNQTINGAHPPYSDMIIAAIVALKDRDGSSRQAIAKYIERTYANLPPTHSNLLTHHLKRMKNQGLLMMVKHSYMLPPLRSVPFESEAPTSTPTPNPTMDSNIADYSVTSTDTYGTTPGSKAENSSARRKPGRPPKPRHEFGFQVQGQLPDEQPAHEIPHYQPQFDHNSGTSQDFHPQNPLGASGQDFQRQNPLGGSGDDLQSPYGSRQEFQGNYTGGAEPIFASLGLADDGVPPPLPTPENTVVSAKRGRGRPPKSSSASRPVVTSSGDGGGEVEAEQREPRLKRNKPKLMSIMLFNGGGVKRGVGRPRRIGRPVTVPLSGNVIRKRGRPRRTVPRPSGYYAENVSDNGDGGEGGSVSVSRGRGRPPKNSGSANKEPKLNPQFDWPNEGAAGTSVLVTDPQQLVAFQELKSKYDHLQLKTREVLDVVRPYISSDYADFGVLLELETLMETDVNPPQQV